jgi:hypothetical protein
LLFGLSFKTQFGLEAKDERHHSQQNNYGSDFDHSSAETYAFFSVLPLVLLFFLFAFLFVSIFLVYLVIQYLGVAFAVIHLPLPIQVAVDLSESASHSFYLTHSFELVLFMKTYFLDMGVAFLFEKLFVFFIDVDFHLWFCVIVKIVLLFSVSFLGLSPFLCFCICLSVLCLYSDSYLLIVVYSLSLIAQCFIGLLYFLKPVFICSFVDVRMVYFGKFEVILFYAGGRGCGRDL